MLSYLMIELFITYSILFFTLKDMLRSTFCLSVILMTWDTEIPNFDFSSFFVLDTLKMVNEREWIQKLSSRHYRFALELYLAVIFFKCWYCNTNNYFYLQSLAAILIVKPLLKVKLFKITVECHYSAVQHNFAYGMTMTEAKYPSEVIFTKDIILGVFY